MHDLRHLLGLSWLLLAPGSAGPESDCPPPRGSVTLHWTAASHRQSFRLRGSYTLRSMNDGLVHTLASPSNDAASTIELAPGLYGLQLDPGSCVETRPAPSASSVGAPAPTAECVPTPSVTTLVIVEPGKRRDVALTPRLTRAPEPPAPPAADRTAACR
jgi:hypothetical protein